MVDGGHDYDFKITRVHITPLTSHLASNLRATPAGTCGRDPKAWRPGVAQVSSKSEQKHYVRKP